MRLPVFLSTVSIFFLAQTVVAQTDGGNADIPTCAEQCVEQTSCGVITTACLCTSATFTFLQNCISTGCSPADQDTSINALQSFCASGSDDSSDSGDSTDDSSNDGSSSSDGDASAAAPKAKPKVPNPNAPQPQIPPKGSSASKVSTESVFLFAIGLIAFSMLNQWH